MMEHKPKWVWCRDSKHKWELKSRKKLMWMNELKKQNLEWKTFRDNSSHLTPQLIFIRRNRKSMRVKTRMITSLTTVSRLKFHLCIYRKQLFGRKITHMLLNHNSLKFRIRTNSENMINRSLYIHLLENEKKQRLMIFNMLIDHKMGL